MAYNAKTNWQYDEIPTENDMNRIEQGIKDVDNAITSHSTDTMPHQSGLNSYASGPDANGVYTVVDYKRADGTLYMKSTLSGGTSPNYTTDTWQFYDATGTMIILTKTWTLTYDANGKITSKVVA